MGSQMGSQGVPHSPRGSPIIVRSPTCDFERGVPAPGDADLVGGLAPVHAAVLLLLVLCRGWGRESHYCAQVQVVILLFKDDHIHLIRYYES